MTEGILLVNKPSGCTSFKLVEKLRRATGVQTIGHAGTLDPMATGVVVMLIGKKYTKMSDRFLNGDKEYAAEITLGYSTDTFDREGKITETSAHIPSLEDVLEVLKLFEGEIEQTPPMFSAKKVKGQKLCDLARKGHVVERAAVKVRVHIDFLSYEYPLLKLRVACSKGTYIRSLAQDIGEKLTSKATLTALQRTRSGSFSIDECIDGSLLFQESSSVKEKITQFLKDESSF